MSVATIVWLAAAAGSALSLALRRPWTSVLARRRVPPPVWEHPLFRETNMVMTVAWTLLFAGAAAVSAATPWWSSGVMGVIFFGLGELSHVAGRRYSEWRLSRAARG